MCSSIKIFRNCKNSDKERQYLHNHYISASLKNKLTNLDFNTANSKSQIIQITIGSVENTEKLLFNIFK
jgi:7-keto-8-aminopelargonate synthetase-like enzyme